MYKSVNKKITFIEMTRSINSNYDVKDELDIGYISKTYKVSNKYNKKPYVLKKIPFKDKKQSNIIKDKLLGIQKSKNKYLAEIIEFFPEKNDFNIIMEFFNGLNLRNFINEQNNESIKKEIILYILLNICEGLKELHDNNIVCINLKPENIFLNEDLIFKIGDFGIPIQLIKNIKNFSCYSEDIGIIEEKVYDYKDDIGALGDILLELCTLKKYSKEGDKSINIEYYGNELQNLIYQLLNEDYNSRPDINMALETIKNIINNLNMNIEKRQKILQENKIFTKYIIQKSIDYSLDNNFLGDMSSKDLNMINLYEQIFKVENLYTNNLNDKNIFINENFVIIKTIVDYLLKFNMKKLNEKISKTKINIYNKNNYFKNIIKVKNLLVSEKYVNDQRLKNVKENSYNIVLINNGENKLINEFLNLKNGERIEEQNYNKELIDLKIYNGIRNNKKYTFFDLKGINNIINNENKDIFTKLKDIIIKKGNSDSSINCIWYCFQGLNLMEANKKFIKVLLNVYDICEVPIIFVHFNKKYSEYKSNICREEIEKYLNEIYSKDEAKVNNLSHNYINIYLSGNENNSNSFGLDDLENTSVNNIKNNLFYKKMQDILTNGIFDLLFPIFIVKNIAKCILENLDNKTNTLLNIINDDEFDLNYETKENNQVSIVQIFCYIEDIKITLINDLKKELDIEKLKSNRQEIINKYYYEKSKEYKDKININKFNQNVNSFIYKELNSHSDELINNIINLSLHLFIIQKIKESIKEQYQDYQKQIINEIYNKLFNEQKEKYLVIQNKNLIHFQTNYNKNNKKTIFRDKHNFKNFNIKYKPVKLFERKEESKIQKDDKLQNQKESNNIHNYKNKINNIQYIQTQNEKDIIFKLINNKNNFNFIKKIEKIDKINNERTKTVPKQNIKYIKESDIQPIFQNNKRLSANPNKNFEEEKKTLQNINNYGTHYEKNMNIPFTNRNPNYKCYNNFKNTKEEYNPNKLGESKYYQTFNNQNNNKYLSHKNIRHENLPKEKYEESKEQNSIKKDNSNYINEINNIFKQDNINKLNFNKSFYYKKNRNLKLNENLENEIFNKTYKNASINLQYRKPIFCPPKVNRPIYQIIFNQPIIMG